MNDVWQLACLDAAGTTVRDDGLVERAYAAAIEAADTARGSSAHADMLTLVRATMGESRSEVFRRLFGADRAMVDRAEVAFDDRYAELVGSSEIRPIVGALETITALRKAGVRVALTTDLAAAATDVLVAALGWADAVDLLVCPGRDVRGAPHPDQVLAAAGCLDVREMEAVVVVGDSPLDMISGVAAGAGLVLGVLTGVGDRRSLADAGATRTMGSIGELPGLLGLE